MASEGVASQASAIRRAVGRIQGGGPRNLTAAGAKKLRSAAGAKRAGNLKTSKAGQAVRSGLRSGALITQKQARRGKRRVNRI